MSLQQGKSIDQSVNAGDENDPSLEVRTAESNTREKTLVETQADLSLVNLNIDKTKDTGGTGDTGGKTRINHPCIPKELTRHVNQLFIRGDTVVTVIPVK